MALKDPTHLILNLGGCNKERLASKEFVKEFLDTMPAKIGMTLIKESDPFFYEDELNSGATGVSVLAESHCSAHSFDKRGMIFLDIFSCSSFDTSLVTAMCVEAFEAKKVKSWIIGRGELFDDYEVENHVQRFELGIPSSEDC